MNLPEQLKHLRSLKHTEKEAKRTYEDAKADRVRFEQSMYEYMEDQGIDGITSDKTRYSRRETIYGHVDDIDAFAEWCASMELDEDFFDSKPSKGRINELVRTHLSEGRELPPGLKEYAQQSISITEQ